MQPHALIARVTAFWLILALGLPAGPAPALALRAREIGDAAGLEQELSQALQPAAGLEEGAASFRDVTAISMATTILDALLDGTLRFLVLNRDRPVRGEALAKPGRYRAMKRQTVCGIVEGRRLYISLRWAAPLFGISESSFRLAADRLEQVNRLYAAALGGSAEGLAVAEVRQCQMRITRLQRQYPLIAFRIGVPAQPASDGAGAGGAWSVDSRRWNTMPPQAVADAVLQRLLALAQQLNTRERAQFRSRMSGVLFVTEDGHARFLSKPDRRHDNRIRIVKDAAGRLVFSYHMLGVLLDIPPDAFYERDDTWRQQFERALAQAFARKASPVRPELVEGRASTAVVGQLKRHGVRGIQIGQRGHVQDYDPVALAERFIGEVLDQLEEDGQLPGAPPVWRYEPRQVEEMLGQGLDGLPADTLQEIDQLIQEAYKRPTPPRGTDPTYGLWSSVARLAARHVTVQIAAGVEEAGAARDRAVAAAIALANLDRQWRKVTVSPAEVSRALPPGLLFTDPATYSAIPLAARAGFPTIVVVSTDREWNAVRQLWYRVEPQTSDFYVVFRGGSALDLYTKRHRVIEVGAGTDGWLERFLAQVRALGAAVLSRDALAPALEATRDYFRFA